MILFVDDERRVMDSYSLELALCGYDVRFETKVDVAINFFEAHLNQIDLLVLDIMMPTGESFKNSNTTGGLRTGLPFYKRVRQRTPQLPVVILTNVTDEGIEEFFKKEKHCWFLRKVDFLPFEFAKEVNNIIPLPPVKKEDDKEEK